MIRLEDITRGTIIKGILPNENVTVIDAAWYGDDAIELTYKDSRGKPGNELLFRSDQDRLEIVRDGQPWSFNGDGAIFRLVSEAHRIRLAHLFDPRLAVHTSLVEPLPHQIDAVYNQMLNRQPLRFLLADDPGAGKTIMAGLLIRELLIRGDLQKCLIVCPGSLAIQWQDELSQKFHLPFEILTNDRLEAARSGNAFTEIPLLVAQLDKLSRNPKLQAKLAQTDWDLVVVDEAHKLSASFFGGEIKETKRYKLGKLLSGLTRHFLLMTATPHNGKEEDFQLFLALLDADRFEGKFRDGVHVCETADLMRRLIKENLLKFDGRPLFPERRAHTVEYRLSELEAILYKQVTDYVKEEFNRADNLQKGRRGTVGFALTILQRRLASSPEAIYQSLKRRRDRLQKRLREEQLNQRGLNAEFDLDQQDIDDDLEDLPSSEREKIETEVVDLATASRTVQELQTEIERLRQLEELAQRVRRSGKDCKWEQLSKVMENEIFAFPNPQNGDHEPGQKALRKLVIFTEHRDTLNYLRDRIKTLLGRPEAVVTIHGSMGRDERKKAEEDFKQDVTVQVLVATDAAGEGINLQRAHLMVNYDLPWNPNRLEQRFGRIHRIGQTEVCHLWNLVAGETREGDVYLSLLRKLEIEQNALGGQVFDVLGKAIAQVELRELLIEAIRYGDRPDIKAKQQQLSDRLNREYLQTLIEEKALARDSLDTTKVQAIREDMERAQARKLQPHFIGLFFQEAFTRLGGTMRLREPRRYEITNVPGVIRHRDRQIGLSEPILRRYERICFEKDLISLPGKPIADLVCPGHPLLDATLDLILERHRNLLRQGSILVDDSPNPQPERILVYLEHSIQDARTDSNGQRRLVSRRMQYVELPCSLFPDRDPTPSPAINGGYAPYLDYRPLTEEEHKAIAPFLPNLPPKEDIEKQATTYAITHLVQPHLEEVQKPKQELIDKTLVAVKDRLTKEINYWDQRAVSLRLDEKAGKPNAKLNSSKAQQRADELASRLDKRLRELEDERRLSPLPPVVVGAALIIPSHRLAALQPPSPKISDTFAKNRKAVELAAMEAVMRKETELGYQPRDVSAQKCGYDIESVIPETGQLRFIEVKGRIEGAQTVTVTKNEILTALNRPDSYILALVEVPGDRISYIHQPFQQQPDFAAHSVNYSWRDLIINN
ncbi:MAG: helicase-related protein [Limnospira sp. PMC 1286.21]|uniref:helicase-related protein n=1 Tax=unclassified Limnospira TaxID=2642885 RepID=UPI0028E14772|nr:MULTISPECIES: helicase-related protein [unclassified Limnospira]MDT9302727.1 helicase-related protein [Limnospira sp. PMC 1281.21]MDT9328208.1 helicase-related protein [Limnospira sp. PMC 1286.21]